MNYTESCRGAQAVMYRAHLFLTGHPHRFWNEIPRKDDTLSLIAPAFFESPYAVLAWVDSGGPAVQIVDSHEENTIVITYPLPKSQLTGRANFNLTKFSERILSFSQRPRYLTVYVDDRFIDRIVFQRTIRALFHIECYCFERNSPSATSAS
jgi:hypothetical protein